METPHGAARPADASEAAVIDWLLDSDPSLRWQVERDLTEKPEEVWRQTRARTATEGFGRRLLEQQDADGQWSGGAYFPAQGTAGYPSADDAPRDREGQPWTATTWSLNALRSWGVPPAALGHTAERLEANARWEYEDLPYWAGEVDVCINAFTLLNGLWLGRTKQANADWFVDHQMAEGGWNCEWVEGSSRASVHSTLNALEALLEFERVTGGSPDVRAARHAGEEYLLRRHLLRRLRTGEPLTATTTTFCHPHRHAYSALRALDYFREATVYDGGAEDPRLAEAIDVVRQARQPDGTWLQGRRLGGKVWFEEDAPVGEPSRGVTLRALRVLRWWEGETRAGQARADAF
ncbi:squalene cyclase [Zhihengliuella flava]|uniref:Squalene cyclase n=1 Tax=Zhihengliuella flava TaxID=1285193 RepID=A0A931DET2_9MICC|nr:squalene cyclase [Zhihengliuella flava]MBG6085515.1 hypothetical protein [Zhihengliuella flava]